MTRILQRNSLFALLGIAAELVIAKSALATPGQFDNALIGDPFPGYSGIWRNGSLGNGNGYVAITDGNNLYLNAPASNGVMLFRAGGVGRITDPTGFTSQAYIDSSGNFVAGTVSAVGGMATTSAGNNNALNATSSGNGVGLHVITTSHTNPFTAIFANNDTTLTGVINGIYVSTVSNSSGAAALEAESNGGA